MYQESKNNLVLTVVSTYIRANDIVMTRVGGKRGSTDSDCGGGSHDTITCNLSGGKKEEEKAIKI